MLQQLRRVSVATVLTLLTATAAFAQEVVTTRYCLVPKTGTNLTSDPIRPKYIVELGQLPNQVRPNFTVRNYGLENIYLVAVGLTPTQLTSLSGNLDVIMLPADLDSPISLIALSSVKNKLDGMFIPADDLTSDTTYRQAIHRIGIIFSIMQRYNGLFNARFFQNGGDLDIQLRNLTGQRAQLLTAAQDVASSAGFQLNTANIKGTTTVREALHIIGAQFPPFTFGNQQF